MYFIFDCKDKPHSQKLRASTREKHLAYLQTRRDDILTAGPQLNDESEVIGSLIIMKCDSRAAADAFIHNDPYYQAGLFSELRITPYRATL